MFESAELGHSIDNKTFRKEVESLRVELLNIQFELREAAKFPVLLLISGVDGGGKSETINMLYEWLDPRFLSTLAFSTLTDEERDRPHMWRYWRSLPPKGRIGIFAGSWYSSPIAERIEGKRTPDEVDHEMARINRFEGMLANEGALVLKFWFHLSKKAQRARFEKLESDPRTAWRVTKESWSRLKTHDELIDVAGHVLRITNTPWAPWIVVDGSDDNYRNLRVGKALLEALKYRLANAMPQNFPVAPPMPPRIDGRDVLTALDLSLTVEKAAYERQLAKWQGRLSELVRHPKFRNRALVLAFEGSDAAGKGGAIRRITAAIDARQFQIVPVAAPTDEERAQPYLWRFWRHVPRKGRVTIFDRTWYGRVLVERVEGFCSEPDWLRAYTEINDFEHALDVAGVIVVKFWLQIDAEEQLRRFKEREAIDFKRFKITEEDWRNREKWDAYREAVCDMVDRTSTGQAPWTLVEANDKKHARIKILKTVCQRIERELGL
ncbi:polyphosphate:AMP phosphotransferase [Niveibacterium sp. 24ML]|uniref:polyphosphate:AMP phosphotransferase n=1 Tax=Niveibacterium sp. 24ML TaxID=2985512 RepID=UPI00226F0976|nr:polyphosphate:AMP phosphotransferase [Niveibacterium sp. 24ML]MCX9157714.1 polyphosphate:AMP phosphotransferase [Niveibacterium sp. 24ML]